MRYDIVLEVMSGQNLSELQNHLFDIDLIAPQSYVWRDILVSNRSSVIVILCLFLLFLVISLVILCLCLLFLVISPQSHNRCWHSDLMSIFSLPCYFYEYHSYSCLAWTRKSHIPLEEYPNVYTIQYNTIPFQTLPRPSTSDHQFAR